MSDHDKKSGGHSGGHDDHGVGAHEVDKMPSSRLFNLLFGLSGLTLVACIGVVQLFYRQVDTIRDTRDTKVSFQLAEYRQEMEALRTGAVLEMTDDDGVAAAQGGKGVHEVRRFQMPLADARNRVLEQPQLLRAARPHRGWTSPDANAPKNAAPLGPMPRGPRPALPRNADGQPPGGPMPGGPMIMPRPPGAPILPGAEGKAPAEAPAQPAEGTAPAQPAEGKAPAKGEGKGASEGKGEGKGEGKSAEGKAG